MNNAKIIINKCVQDSQDFGSDDEHMISRIFFDLEVKGQLYKDIYVEIKQSVGGSIETYPIEVGRPVGYKGPFNYAKFRDIAEKYYRSLVGSQGNGIRVEGGGNIRMRNNMFVKTMVVELKISESDMGW